MRFNILKSREDEFALLATLIIVLFLLSFGLFSHSVSLPVKIIFAVIAGFVVFLIIKVLKLIRSKYGY